MVMRSGHCSIAAVVFSAVLSAQAAAQTFDFVGAPGVNGVTRLHGISADGTVATGYSATGGSPFTWTRAGGRIDLPFSGRAFAISGDGTTIAGLTFPGSGVAAFRQRVGVGTQVLGSVSGLTNSQANGVNGDGNVIAGEAFDSTGSRSAWRGGGRKVAACSRWDDCPGTATAARSP